MARNQDSPMEDSAFLPRYDEERAEVRTVYSRLWDGLQLVGPSPTDMEKVKRTLREADAATHRKQTPREMAMDASVIRQAVYKLHNLIPGEAFNVSEFVARMKGKLTRSDLAEASKPEPSHWVAFPARKFVLRPVYLQNLGIHLETEPPAVQTIRKSVRRKPCASSAPPVKRLTVLKPKEKVDEDVLIQRRLEVARKALKKAVKDNGSHPVHYFRFAVDPASFEATVRNMLTLSFLLNRHEAVLVFDKRDQPHIFLKDDEKRLKNRADSKLDVEDRDGIQVSNWIVSLTVQDWQKIVQVYGITQAKMPALKS